MNDREWCGLVLLFIGVKSSYKNYIYYNNMYDVRLRLCLRGRRRPTAGTSRRNKKLTLFH